MYGERIANINLFGMALIIAGVCCVSFKFESETKINYNMLWIAVGFALALGFSLAFNAWIVKYFVKNAGFTPITLTIDANAVSGFPMLIIFIYV